MLSGTKWRGLVHPGIFNARGTGNRWELPALCLGSEATFEANVIADVAPYGNTVICVGYSSLVKLS